MQVSGCILVPISKKRYQLALPRLKELMIIRHKTKYSETTRVLFEWFSNFLVIPRFSLVSKVYDSNQKDALRNLRQFLFSGLDPLPNTSHLVKFPGDPWTDSEEEKRARLIWSAPSFERTEQIVDSLFAGALSKQKRKMGIMGAFVEARVGTGKTFVVFSVMRRLRCKSMFLFHNTGLAEEKYDLAKEFFNVPIGRYYGKYDEDGDVVIASIQSVLAKKPFTKFCLKDFGFLAVDEAHNFAAKSFLKVFPKMRAEVTLGLSGTPTRLDHMERAVYAYLGPLVNVSKMTGFEKAPQFRGKYKVWLYSGEKNHTKWMSNAMGGVDLPRTVTMVTKDFSRQNLIEREIQKLKKNHKTVLVLSGRTIQLNDLESRGCGVVVCGKTPRQKRKDALERAIECGCILSTYAYFGTGRSVESITAVVYASPRKNLHTQFSGRCMRMTKDVDLLRKSRDLVDIVDVKTILKNQYYRMRKSLYASMGFYADEKKISAEDLKCSENTEELSKTKTLEECLFTELPF